MKLGDVSICLIDILAYQRIVMGGVLLNFATGFSFHVTVVVALGEALEEVAAEEGEERSGLLVLASVDELVLEDGVFVREIGGEVDAVAEAETGEVDAGESSFI